MRKIICSIFGHAMPDYKDRILGGSLLSGTQTYQCTRCKGYFQDHFIGGSSIDGEIRTYKLTDKGIKVFKKLLKKQYDRYDK